MHALTETYTGDGKGEGLTEIIRGIKRLLLQEIFSLIKTKHTMYYVLCIEGSMISGGKKSWLWHFWGFAHNFMSRENKFKNILQALTDMLSHFGLQFKHLFKCWKHDVQAIIKLFSSLSVFFSSKPDFMVDASVLCKT